MMEIPSVSDSTEALIAETMRAVHAHAVAYRKATVGDTGDALWDGMVKTRSAVEASVRRLAQPSNDAPLSMSMFASRADYLAALPESAPPVAPAAQEPVAWQSRTQYEGEGWGEWRHVQTDNLHIWRRRVEMQPHAYALRPLYAHPEPAPADERELPEEATPGMISAMHAAYWGAPVLKTYASLTEESRELWRKTYRALCAALAAPKEPT